MQKHGARVYRYPDGVVLVKQTVKKVKDYVIDTRSDGTHVEKHVDPGNDALLGESVRLACQGLL